METSKRFNMNLPEGEMASLKRLADAKATTMTAVITEAVAREVLFMRERDKGNRILIESPQGDRAELVWAEDSLRSFIQVS